MHNIVDNLFDRAQRLHQTGHLLEARSLYGQILKELPMHVGALNLLGVTYCQVGEYQKGLPFITKALDIKPSFVEAYNNLGNALRELNRYEQAMICYQQALAIKPDYIEAYINLANTLSKLKSTEEATLCYQQAIVIKPELMEAYINLGNVLNDRERMEEAIICYRRALVVKPNVAEAYNNLGNTLNGLKRTAEAIVCYQRVLAITPGFAEACNNLGHVLCQLNRYGEAIICYQRVLAINADYGFALGMYLQSKLYSCDWKGIDDTFQAISSGVNAGRAVSDPFSMLAAPSTLAQQKRCAEMYVQHKFPPVQILANAKDRYAHSKIRLAYFSADFHQHATAYLIAELFELHDRSRFEVIGFSYGTSPHDAMYQRLSVAFDRFLDVRNQSDQQIVALAKELEIDIAIDLKGFTTDARTGIFALRAAPIQVNYLGYPGTMGATYIDYLIADSTLIPPQHQPYYSEKIVYLPDTYQVNDSRRPISERPYTRREAGLPDQGFVFCCFNNNYKINPTVFDVWTQILEQVEGSVLWLLEGNMQVRQNLKIEARKRGMEPERLVFAKRMALPDHLARHRLADLFLDTFLYNAHTTASDALWTGLPVLACLGETFASRVAASLLQAIGLSELITYTHEKYKTLAIDLATKPGKLALITQQLAINRYTRPLFNTALFTQHIEDAFTQMWERQQRNLAPDHIYVKTNR